jgi:hypothetical protein
MNVLYLRRDGLYGLSKLDPQLEVPAFRPSTVKQWKRGDTMPSDQRTRITSWMNASIERHGSGCNNDAVTKMLNAFAKNPARKGQTNA